MIAACSSGAPSNVTGASGALVFGEDDRVVVDDDATNVPEKYRLLLDAIGVMFVHDGGWCTVTHVGGGLAVTAGHCFGAGDEVMKNVSVDATIRWGVRGKTKATWPYLVSTVTTVLEARRSRPGPDYAFFKVDPVPSVAIPLELDTRPAVGTALTFFSHPWGRPLEWSRTCTLMPSQDAGGPLRFEHTCPTETGSSGAAVLDDTTLRIVGIHNSDNSTGTQPATANEATYIVDTPAAAYVEPPASAGPDPDASVP